ncbi:RNA pol II accessory factor, Cdc73 family-domain-containing protein [Protomyces lactucae-debilis]|uniref:RNA pol II accessory factor, Cdc73 family-domain-containing protein n=1 Tax=Protomyces lactucae-debilis TaxID=2754530 RepID=A0A1Y2FF34_PROLT|nr:RNA pol II accessory factor, Cdc73 family-domain-containing protein [Protomyces lactucae-debilis]ORY82014.1 RNA pol II accessory factor, Cdc73 family-domain-containing protein [Protomyces lactucae-debilis]
MSDPLTLLSQAVAASQPLQLLSEAEAPVDDIRDATTLQIAEERIALDQKTRFERSGEALDLRTIYFAWLHKDAGSADYIEACSSRNIPNLSFLEKQDLIALLTDAAHQSSFVAGNKRPAEDDAIAAEAKKQATDKIVLSEEVAAMAKLEHHSKPFSAVLHGRKLVDFSSVQREARDFFLVKSKAEPAAAIAKPAKSRLRDPIILLSPSASSLITMHNVKKFLEDGVFVPPEQAARETGGPAPELLSLAYKSKLRPGYTLRFVVVESTDKFKPEYWDRLLVVFTTGQAWQFKPYAQSFSDPRSLFQKCKGVLVKYSDDAAIPAERDWNIQSIKVDRARRYNDRVTVSAFWHSIEKWMEEKGKRDFYRHERR